MYRKEYSNLSTKIKYADFIRNNHYNNPTIAYGQCKTICKNMVFVFPELKIFNGKIYFTDDNCSGRISSKYHWWLEDEEGRIIDPTISQFKPEFNNYLITYTYNI